MRRVLACLMATLFYLTTVSATYTPATIRGAWDDTAGAVTRALDTTKINGGAITTVARAETNAADEYDVLLYRGVSGPLAAQTINCNVDVVLGVSESSTSANAHWHLHIYVTQGDSDTPRGTLVSDYREAAGTNEWPTTAAGLALNAAQATGSLAISAGDRIVCEIGYTARNTSTSSYTGTLWYGTTVNGDVVSDLTASGDETSLAGFVTFSQTLTEQAVTTWVSQLAVEPVTSVVGDQRVSQLAVEAVISSAVAEARVSQLVVEVVHETPSGVTGTGTVDAAPATMAGTGGLRATATGAVTAQPATATGVGALEFRSAGAVTAAPATADAVGRLTIQGAGAVTAEPATVAVQGSVGLGLSVFPSTTRPIRRLRQAPHLTAEHRRLRHLRFALDLERGRGQSLTPGDDPQVMLRWSDDGGRTWSREYWVSAGKVGEYRRRAIWRRLGQARTRTYQVVCTDPAAWLDAWIDLEEGNR